MTHNWSYVDMPLIKSYHCHHWLSCFHSEFACNPVSATPPLFVLAEGFWLPSLHFVTMLFFISCKNNPVRLLDQIIETWPCAIFWLYDQILIWIFRSCLSSQAKIHNTILAAFTGAKRLINKVVLALSSYRYLAISVQK